MGHNVDLGVFGIVLRCQRCKKDLDLSEVDIDCDVLSHSPMNFELSIQCLNPKCDFYNYIEINMVEEVDEDE